jgi:hypothetical protein
MKHSMNINDKWTSISAFQLSKKLNKFFAVVDYQSKEQDVWNQSSHHFL